MSGVIFHILTGEDIDDVISFLFVAVYGTSSFVYLKKITLCLEALLSYLLAALLHKLLFS